MIIFIFFISRSAHLPLYREYSVIKSAVSCAFHYISHISKLISASFSFEADAFRCRKEFHAYIYLFSEAECQSIDRPYAASC